MLNQKNNRLFTAFSLSKNVSANNRLFLAPMTTTQSRDHGLVSETDLNWLAKCAQGGFGTIITPAAAIAPDVLGFDGQISVASDAHIPGLKKLAEALSAHGAISLLQICHPGMRAPSRLNGGVSVAPSAVKLNFPNFEIPRALSITEIEKIINDFANATLRAKQAGFNGVEIHGANGYLITQFIHCNNNQRQDDYGGSLENRARFARAIVRACRAAVPEDFIIGFRISPEGDGLDLDENLQIAQWIKQDGADYVHLSTLNANKTANKYPDSDKKLVTRFRVALGKDFPILVTGGIKQVSEAQEAQESGADLVGLGQISIGNTDWAKRAQSESNYAPWLPPYSESLLLKQGITPEFVSYIKTLPMNIIQVE